MKEVYWNSTKDMLLLEDQNTHSVVRFDELVRSFFHTMDIKISENYPDVYEELCREIGVGVAYEYGRVYQFSACNFSTKDGQPDIDDDGNFILEKVSCPIRHTCKKGYCSARVSGKLSGREIQVISFFVKGYTEEESAERLFISKSTVHNHINNIYTKLGFTGTKNPDRLLVAHAIKHKLVN